MRQFKGSYFTRLCALVVAGALALFWLIDVAVKHAETQLSFIHPDNQTILTALAVRAEALYKKNDSAGLNAFLEDTQEHYS